MWSRNHNRRQHIRNKLKKSNKTEESRREPRDFGITFSVVFAAYYECDAFERKTEH